jgi:hypothetical protein
MNPLDRVIEAIKDRRHVATPERLVNLSHSIGVIHLVLLRHIQPFILMDAI